MTIQRITLALIFALFLTACHSVKKYDNMDDYPIYEEGDLGCIYSKTITSFRIWSPPAEEAKINIYENGENGEPIDIFAMKADKDGTWLFVTNEDLKGKYFTYQVKIDGNWLGETPGIYTKAVGVNGKRGYICNPNDISPEKWSREQWSYPKTKKKDIILYELHVRDLSMNPNSGIENRGKFLGIAEGGTKSDDGLPTGLDHIKEMGITHLHLLPFFDYHSVDETKLNENNFNWGYDPQNYNVPEGSYSTDPYNPETRILEMKTMVETLHKSGIQVVMDVVYNHTGGPNEMSNFNLLVPNYYYRTNPDGSWSNASGCGNETASERPMMRKYMIESLSYWMNQYHIDGFRFDLMGIHDIETMNLISEKLHNDFRSVFIYGEGWTAGDSPLPFEKRALKAHTTQFDRIASFSDDIRDAIKGHWSNVEEKGFVSGKNGMEESIKFGITGSTFHPEIDYSKVNYSDTSWADEPTKCINYVSCHDNNTLYDKLKISCPEASEEDIIKMDILANTIVLTSQGVPFLHAGVEMLRTKKMVENSYNVPDSINQIDWSRKKEFSKVVEFYKSLIQLRKHHTAFRMGETKLIQEHLHFLDVKEKNVVAYQIKDAPEDNWKDIIVIFNGNNETKTIDIPQGEWKITLKGDKILENGLETFSGDKIDIDAISALILVKK